MPLRTMWIRPTSSLCGWAFSSVTRPWVAQRVWARPIVASVSATATAPSSRRSATAALRFARLPDRADGVDPPVIEQGETGGVVSAVLELLEARDQQVAAWPPAHISDDAAHGVSKGLRGRQRIRGEPEFAKPPCKGATSRRGARSITRGAQRSERWVGRSAQFGVGHGDEPAEDLFALGLVGSLDHDADQRLGARRAGRGRVRGPRAWRPRDRPPPRGRSPLRAPRGSVRRRSRAAAGASRSGGSPRAGAARAPA